MPILLALASSVMWGCSDFVGGTLTRRLPALVVVGISQLIAGIAVALVALGLGEFSGSRTYVLWGVAAALVGTASLLAFYAALAGGTMGVVAPIAALGAVVPVVVGLASGERPAVAQLMGIALAVVGVALASGPEISGAAGPRPVVLAALAAVGFGFTFLLLAEGSETSALMTTVTMRATSGPLLTVVALLMLRRTGTRLAVRDLALLAFIGFGDVGANLAFGLASRGELISLVSVLGSVYPVVTVLLARGFHGERLLPVQNIGVALALGGVALIAAG